MRNYKNETLDREEARLKRRYKPIRFSNKRFKIKKIDHILDKLYNKRYANNGTEFLNGAPHCHTKRARSIIDGYLLCMHYLPKVSYAEYYNRLKEVIAYSSKKHYENNRDNVYAAYLYHNDDDFYRCNTIGRVRFCYNYTLKFKC